MEPYIETLLQMDKACTEFKESTIRTFFVDEEVSLWKGFFCLMPLYQSHLGPIKGLVKALELFGIESLERNKESLVGIIHNLEEPQYMYYRQIFEDQICMILEIFSDKDVKKAIRNRLLILDTTEIDRLNEAIHCFLEDCNYSAVAMSVSAIEFRLLSLMESVQPNPRLQRMTLGQLVNEYLEHKEKYGKVIPKMYEPLLEHCNTYRIFSVHPKKERINKSVATSILHMTFQFLLDKKLAQKTKT